MCELIERFSQAPFRAEKVPTAPDVHELETKLNGYVRLYTDSQSEVEKLKLDARRAEQNSEAEKVRSLWFSGQTLVFARV